MLTKARYSRFMAMLARSALWLSGIGLVAMTIAIAWQVYGRFILNDTPSWAEPLSLLLMLYFILLAAAVGVRENFHLGMDLFRHIASETAHKIMVFTSNVLVGGFGLAMFWWGGELTTQTWNVNIPVLGVPEGLNYLPLALSGVLIFLFSIERIVCPALVEAPPPPTTAE